MCRARGEALRSARVPQANKAVVKTTQPPSKVGCEWMLNYSISSSSTSIKMTWSPKYKTEVAMAFACLVFSYVYFSSWSLLPELYARHQQQIEQNIETTDRKEKPLLQI